MGLNGPQDDRLDGGVLPWPPDEGAEPGASHAAAGGDNGRGLSLRQRRRAAEDGCAADNRRCAVPEDVAARDRVRRGLIGSADLEVARIAHELPPSRRSIGPGKGTVKVGVGRREEQAGRLDTV
jgi:hypothetical protein